MKIVIADSYAALPGDLDWSGIETLGECIFYDRTHPPELAARAADAEVLLINKTPVTDADMEQMPRLRCIGLMITGLNLIDMEAAHRRGITVTNVPHYSTEAVAQMTIAHLLHIAMPIAPLSQQVKEGLWHDDYARIARNTHQIGLYGLTLSIVGLGAIGSRVAAIAHGFGMKVLAYTSKSETELPFYIEKTDSLEELFSRADVLSLHCPLTQETTGIVSAERLAMMKPSAILLNMSRGGLIDEVALASALSKGRLYAAGLDVLSQEPVRPDNPLLALSNCHLTPHMGWNTAAAKRRLTQTVMDNLRAFLSGHPINVV
ncbi:D-2-hydroxyacid dehydrogenase [Porphyromonas loveana]|uniref:D-2-hydroxyacid dehydrogenase n=1 Tax=Porphyromonas loveana TaxID=1884669 RepID=UPI0035A14C75